MKALRHGGIPGGLILIIAALGDCRLFVFVFWSRWISLRDPAHFVVRLGDRSVLEKTAQQPYFRANRTFSLR